MNPDTLLEQANKLGQEASQRTGIAFTPINTETLTPETPVAVPEVVAPTTSSGITGGAQATIDQTNKQLEEARKAQETALTQSKDELSTLQNEILGVTESRSKLEEQAGISEKNLKVSEFTNQLEQSQRAQTNELRALSGLGLTDVQKAQKSREINRQYAFEQADLQILLNGAQRNFQAAQANIDRKINLALEPLKLKLDFATKFYDENKENFDKADNRAFENLIKQNERAYNEEKTRLETLENTKLELLKSASSQGADNSVLSSIQRARTPQDAIVAAGRYSGDILERQIKQAQLSKLNADAAKAIAELGKKTQGPLAKAQAQGNIELISGLADDKYLRTAVGPNPLARTSFSNLITGGKSNFVSGIEQLRTQLTLDNLISAKEKGATFGALSEGELALLNASATKMGSWAIKDDDGKVVGYKVGQDEFKKELDKIQNFAKLDYIIKGGDPADIDVVILEDGSYATRNSDGSVTILNP